MLKQCQATHFFFRQCASLGYTSFEAFGVLWAYRKTGVATLVGNRFLIEDERYWQQSWLDAAIKFYKKEHPAEMKINSPHVNIDHKIADYFEGGR